MLRSHSQSCSSGSKRARSAALLGAGLARLGDTALIDTFARRGVGASERARVAALVRVAVAAPKSVESRPVHPTREAELVALYRWYVDWSATARATVMRKDWLVAMGLAERKGRGVESAHG